MKNKYAAIVLTVLIFIAVKISLVSAQETKIYELNLSYDKGDISLMSEISARAGYAPDRKIQPEIGYKAEILSLTDNVLYLFKFEAPNMVCSDILDPDTKKMSGGCTQIDKTDFTLFMPYFENGKIINIYNPDGKKVFFASVEHLAKTCGDSICQMNETNKICPQDCLINKVDTTKTNGKLSISVVVEVVFILVVVAAIIFILKRRKDNISGI